MPAVTSAPRRWQVLAGDAPVLELTDEPGAITSTAAPPPTLVPVTHPFLSARALDAEHEGTLRRILGETTSVDEFVRALEAAGYRVVALT